MIHKNLHFYALELLTSLGYAISDNDKHRILVEDYNFSDDDISHNKEMIEDATRWGHINDEYHFLILYLNTKFS